MLPAAPTFNCRRDNLPARRRYRNAGRFEICRSRLTAYPRFTLNAPQTPAELAQRDDLLVFFFAQNIAHFDGA